MNIDTLVDRLVALSGDCELLISARVFRNNFTVYSEIDEDDESIAPLKARLHTFATKGGEVLRRAMLDDEPPEVSARRRKELEALVAQFKEAVMRQAGSSFDRYHFAINVEPFPGGSVQ